MTTISVIIPVLDEAQALPLLLDSLQGRVDEILVVDGGSRDDSVALAQGRGARVIHSPPGRGLQLARGGEEAKGDVLWFLHADTVLDAAPVLEPAPVLDADPVLGAEAVPSALAALRSATTRWGCFEVRLDSDDPRLRLTARLMNRRARRGGSCTGDMGMWFRRDLYIELGGFSSLPALEDLELSDRARRYAPAAVLTPALTASARRWERHGVMRTVVLMWSLRLGYRLGLPPVRLAACYRRPAR